MRYEENCRSREMTITLDGKVVAKELNKKTAAEANRLKQMGVIPTVAILRADKNEASIQYEKMATRFMDKLGIQTKYATFEDGVSEEEFLKALDQVNTSENVHGILVMQPLPGNIRRTEVAKHISPSKDIDGMHALNLGKIMALDHEVLLPSTVKAVLEIFRYYAIDVAGKTAVVIGKSNTVGKPLSVLLMNQGATVINCHTRTKDLRHFTKQADILISATGQIGLIGKEDIKKDAVVIDVGYNFVGNKAYGDVRFDEVYHLASAITPVPGGVGSVTTASLASQLVQTAMWSIMKRGDFIERSEKNSQEINVAIPFETRQD